MLKALSQRKTYISASSATFHDVRLEEIASDAVLREAWRRVRANKGGPGGDGITIEAFASCAEMSLSTLQAGLLDGTYRPRKLLRYEIPKPGGGKRRLAIPAVVDRIAQTAALVVLGPNFDARMSEDSYAYRSGRGVDQALVCARSAIADGNVWIVDCDIKRFFDRVPHDQLMAELTIWLQDERTLRLFAVWLRSFSWWRQGIAQGSPVSPLLANLYLHPMDRLAATAGHTLVRYADDFVILVPTKEKADKALALVDGLLRRRGLELNRRKTAIVPPGDRIVFLGEYLCAPRERKIA